MPPSEMQFSQQNDFQSELHTGPGTCLGHVEISGMSGNPYFTNWMSNPVLEIPGWEARHSCWDFQRCLSPGVCSQGQTRKCSQSGFCEEENFLIYFFIFQNS